jgi:hypothetical protein
MRAWHVAGGLCVGLALAGAIGASGCASGGDTTGPGSGGNQVGGFLPNGGGGSGGSGGMAIGGSGGSGGSTCGTEELCDGIDNNCDGATDEGCPCVEGDTQACYQDDPLLVGECAKGEQLCDVQGVWGSCAGESLPSAELCNGLDDDCDGATDEDIPNVVCGLGICRVTVAGCDNGQPVPCIPAQPQTELCNGLDDNCDGTPDEGCSCTDGQTQACYNDTPATRNVGECHDGVMTCNQQGQYGDCIGEQTPLANELCNGLDDNCDGYTDEGDPGSGPTCATEHLGICAQGQLHCVGGQPTCVHPAPGTESCNGLDDDCNGTTDDNIPGDGDPCNTGEVGFCAIGTAHCSNGLPQCIPPLPKAETCNGIDDDCDTVTDEGNPGGGVACNSGLAGECAAGTTLCQGGGIVCPQNQLPHDEICNGLDDNCNGSTDENNPGGNLACSTGNWGVCAAGTTHCLTGGIHCDQTTQPAVTEKCDGLDDDCDGSTDELWPTKGQQCSTGLGACLGLGNWVCNGQQTGVVCNAVPAATPGPEYCGDSIDSDCLGDVDPACPPNDYPAGAINISAGGTFPADLRYAHDDDDNTGGCGSTGGRDVFYTFTLAATQVVYADTFGSDFDTVIRIHDGACTNLAGVERACNDDSCTSTQSQLVTQLTAGTYCLVVDQFSGFSTAGAMTLHFVVGGRTGTQIVPGAAELTAVANTCNGTNLSTPSCNNSGHAAADLAYYFTTCPGTATLNASLCTGTSYDSVLYLRAGSAGSTDIACDDDYCSLQSQISGGLAGANLYWVIVDGYSSSSNCGPFALSYRKY